MKITIETTDELDDGLNLAEQRELIHGTFLDFVALFEAAGIEPNFIVRLESSMIESSEHTKNWPEAENHPDSFFDDD